MSNLERSYVQNFITESSQEINEETHYFEVTARMPASVSVRMTITAEDSEEAVKKVKNMFIDNEENIIDPDNEPELTFGDVNAVIKTISVDAFNAKVSTMFLESEEE